MKYSKDAIKRRLQKKQRGAEATDHKKNTSFKPAKTPYKGLQVGVDKKSSKR